MGCLSPSAARYVAQLPCRVEHNTGVYSWISKKVERLHERDGPTTQTVTRTREPSGPRSAKRHRERESKRGPLTVKRKRSIAKRARTLGDCDGSTDCSPPFDALASAAIQNLVKEKYRSLAMLCSPPCGTIQNALQSSS